MRLMSLFENGSAVIFGRLRNQTREVEGGEQWAFSMYNLKSGVLVGRKLLQRNAAPDGVAVVNLAGCQCLALSYGYVSFWEQFEGCIFFVSLKHKGL